MGLGADGELYNINADHMAAACAEYIHADRLIYLTDVAGVLDGSEGAQGRFHRRCRGSDPAE
jgi:acetylglutamate kinase